MFRRTNLSLIPLLVLFALGQFTVPFARENATSSPSVTPFFVSAASYPYVNVTTNPAGQTACANFRRCAHFAMPILSGNIALYLVSYANATSVAFTATDENTDSCTISNGSQSTSGNYWTAYAICATPTAGSYNSEVTFGTTAVTHAAVMPISLGNTNGTVDASNHCNHAASTSFNCTSVTTTLTNDVVVAFFCTDGSTTTSFTPTAGWTPLAANRFYGCFAEMLVQSSPGVVSPTVTSSASSVYTEYLIALGPHSQGIQPSLTQYPEGWVRRVCAENSNGSTGAISYQCPSDGNTLADLNNYGSGMTVSSIADSGQTGTWTQAAGCGNPGGTDAWYLSGASADSSGIITPTTSASGDATFEFLDLTLPTPVYISCAPYANGAQSASASLTLWGAPLISGNLSYLATPTKGLAFFADSEVLNTAVDVSAGPGTCHGLVSTFGGEALDGPTALTPDLENNGWGVCDVSSISSTRGAFKMASATETGNTFTGVELGFFSTGAFAIINGCQAVGASVQNLTCSPPAASTSGTTGVVMAADFNSTARSWTSVCWDSTTCAAGNVFTQCTSCAITSGTGRTTVFGIMSNPSGKTTVTVHLSGSASQNDFVYLEVLKGGSTNAFTEDVGNKVTGGIGNSGTGCTGTGTFDCNASLTTTGSTLDVVLASFNSTAGINECPVAGNEFSWVEDLWNWNGTTGNDGGACGLLTTSASAHRSIAQDSTSGASFSSSAEAYKN